MAENTKTTIIKANLEVSASLDRVWEIIADVDNEPKYYPGLNSVKNISKNDNVIEREVTVGFLNHKARQTVILNPKKSVEIRMTEGPMIGTRVVTLNPSGNNKTMVGISWDFEFVGIPSFFRGDVKNQIANGTEEALDRIARAVQ
jgi:carbon monoxide dehydrogenase subunit G